MKLGPKLLAAPLATAIVVLAAGQLDSWLVLDRQQQAREAAERSLGALKTVAAVKDQLGGLHAGVYRTMTLIGSLDEAQTNAFRADLKRQLEAAQRTFAAVADAQDTVLSGALSSAGARIEEYGRHADAAIDLASVDPNTGVAAMQGADEAFADLTRAAGAIVVRIDERGAESSRRARAGAEASHLLLSLLAGLTAAVAVGLSWWMQRRLVADLSEASRLAGQVAQGRLDVVPSTRRTDEVGDLLRALSHMTEELSRSMLTVQSSSQSIRVASSEIASGSQDLSSRTEQAASSLQQTASSMEQITGTVGHGAESARQASALAGSAAEVAQRGGAVVAQVVSTMNDISASSRKIADIIGTIDGIAFQTNILALNAAVEAARAGEQGRGFAVVAGEVRSLAQRSAEAARQIKSLIGSSVERVDSGTRLVADAGSTMNEIVASVQRVAGIIGEISHAAGEQSAGLGQVNGAVTRLDQMTQQNAALVEQSAAAAESLKDQAARLGAVVQRFTLRPSTVA